MMETMKMTTVAVVTFAVASPGWVSIFVSLIFGFYILNMLYFNIIKKYYEGSWRKYLNAFVSSIFKKNK